MTAEERFSARFPADPAVVVTVRSQAASAALAAGMPPDREPDVQLAVSEVATNVVLHAYVGGPDGPIELSVLEGDDEVTIVIADAGPGLRPRSDSPGAGLGLSIVESVADRLEIVDRAPGTEVRIAFRKARPHT